MGGRAGGHRTGECAGEWCLTAGSSSQCCDVSQVDALKVAIVEEHAARWDAAACVVRRGRPAAGEIGYREAVVERMATRWPDLKHRLLPTDISNLKNTLWRGMLGTNGIKQGGANLAV